MATNVERLNIAVKETLRLQDPQSQEYKNWLHGPRASPLPPGLPRSDGHFYPTSDRALRQIGEIVEDLRVNDKALGLAVGKEAALQQAVRVLGDSLAEIAAETDDRARWKTYREKMRASLSDSVSTRTIYVPVWLFVRQEYGNFSVGPVEFVERFAWLDRVESMEGQTPRWRDQVERIWAPPALTKEGPGWLNRWLASVKRCFLKAPRVQAMTDVSLEHAVNTISRFSASEQRVACVELRGFDRSEAERRGLLATRLAVDTIRLLVPGFNKARIVTAADHGPPRTIDRLSQVHGKGVTAGWHAHHSGVGGAPNMARDLISEESALLTAAGNCIRVAISPTPTNEPLPLLANRWNNALHWYGRGCSAEADFIALPMFGFAMDILAGGKSMEAGIRSLAAALFVKTPHDPITSDGTPLSAVVRRLYEYRSKIAHGSLLAVDLRMDEERALAVSFANAMLYLYVIRLAEYRIDTNAVDDEEEFLRWLERNAPAAATPLSKAL
jgi:hypothetical protein